jgi:hypothetical protein
VVTWYRKYLPLDELGRLTAAFEEIRTAVEEDPRLALFATIEGPGKIAACVPGPIELVRDLSPNGWEPSPPPDPEKAFLIVGSRDAWRRFGLRRDA